MITFTKNSFIIEVQAPTEPVEAWIETQKALIDMLGGVDLLEKKHFRIFILLKEMLPNSEIICNYEKKSPFKGFFNK